MADARVIGDGMARSLRSAVGNAVRLVDAVAALDRADPPAACRLASGPHPTAPDAGGALTSIAIRLIDRNGMASCATTTDATPPDSAPAPAGPVLAPDGTLRIRRDRVEGTVDPVLPLPAGDTVWLRQDGAPPVRIAGEHVRLPDHGREDAGFAERTIAAGIQLLVLRRPATSARRRQILVIGGLLALMLVAGIVLAVVGATVCVVRPLEELDDAIHRWQRGEPFAPRRRRFTPVDVARIGRSLGDATEALATRERELVAARQQQELLMQEIHHRVKNNLQIVASLLNLQASRIRLPQARQEFESARDRVRALATLHRHLYVQGGIHTINMRDFLEELCGQLLHAMDTGRITLDIDAPALSMSTDQAVPLALIVTEAVSNAIKYAFPDGRAGHVRVRLEADADHATLVVADDGVGIPLGRAMTESGIRDGIGLQLIRGFARQLDARLTVTEDAGTRYHVVMPLHRERQATPVFGVGDRQANGV